MHETAFVTAYGDNAAIHKAEAAVLEAHQLLDKLLSVLASVLLAASSLS